MDFFDLLFVYGPIGVLVIYYIILKVLKYIVVSRQFDFLSITIFIIFLYSFFAGHVMTNATSSTLFALLLGLKLNDMFSSNDYILR